MSSEECKESLIDWFGGTEKDWKRVSKKIVSGNEYRTFEDKRNGKKYHMRDEEDYYPASDVVYFSTKMFDGDLCVMFCPKVYWDENHCMWDQHCGDYLEVYHNLPADIEFDESQENMFVVEGMTVSELDAALITAGFVQNDEVDTFLSRSFN